MSLKFSDILKRQRKEKGFTQSDLADVLGVKLRTYQYYEEGRNEPKLPAMIILAQKLDFDINAVYEQNVPKETIDLPEKSYMSKRRDQKNETKEFKAPLVTVKARAGYISSYDSVDLINSLDKYAIPPGVSFTGAIWRYFEVDGDSMEPILSSGDYVLCSQVPRDDWDNLKNFYVYVLVTQNDILIKRVFVKDNGEWVLISDNEQHSPQRLFDISTLKELWVFRRLIKKTISAKKEFKINI